MQFMITWCIDPAQQPTARARFLETQAPPPDGVEMVGRWHAAAGKQGWILAETNDASAILRWTAEWADVIDFDVAPVVGDEDAGRILAGG
ncbi:MAG: DUF3303 domain-containing protein [Planctomycetota bacterium]|jgi:hypothetical protein